ncbi:UvrD-helicase domain-containing protein [Natranaerofaba carboxydovora]|uniref:UvrD-helicase domain-containing protein n=1 Tax=Natranaerofaba carboxydovora TaxID=2742683 RepID=UPI001F146CDD|nr:UvrD-helicase domain-containing protein [Natranaerofaba carboxydovora]UMZ72997.1 ATP-dependent helicase/nuclease subunit A [Natranaerofaba carboxydovora]
MSKEKEFIDQIPDQPQRDQLNKEFNANFFVEASAGSGKTSCLVDRMVYHAVRLENKEDISKIVAITFTKKAAQEFRSRFQEKLEKLLKEGNVDNIDETKIKEILEDDAKREERIHYILDNLDNIFMGTIHSFCARMLRERPIEAELNIGFKEIDDKENETFMENAWNEFLLTEANKGISKDLERTGVYPPQLYNLFLQLDNNKDVDFNANFENEAKDLVNDCEDSKELINLIKNEDTHLKILQKIFGDFYCHMSLNEETLDKEIVEPDCPEEIKRKTGEAFNKNNRKRIANLAFYYEKYRCKEEELLENYPQLLEMLENFTKIKLKQSPTEIKVKDKDKKKTLKKKFKERLQEENEKHNVNKKIAELLKLYYELKCYQNALDFAHRAAQFAQEKRKKESLVSFEDLLFYSRNLLLRSQEARDFFQKKYCYFYVDEFQDTDPLQTEILFYLTASEFKENWQEIIPNKGSLFIVGDPKQSIYRFKRADVINYSLVKQIIEKADGRVINLTTNFRSVDALCKDFNEIFNKLLPKDDSDTQVTYEEVQSGRSALTSDDKRKEISGIKVLPQIKLPTENQKEHLLKEDPPRVAEFIYNAVESGEFNLARNRGKGKPETLEPANYGDFMLLTYDKSDMDVYIRELQKLKIPYTLSGESCFSESLGIRELVKILESIENPYDEVKTVAALRSIFLGVSDEELFEYRTCGKNFILNKDLSDKKNKEERSNIEDKMVTLEHYNEWAKLYSPVVLMEKIIDDLKVVPYSIYSYTCAEDYDHLKREENGLNLLYQLLETMRGEEINGNIYNITSLIRRINFWMDENIDNEMPFEIESGLNAVSVMNLHKAKGLQAPVVILAKPCGKSNISPSVHVERTDDMKVKGYLKIQEKVGDKKFIKNLISVNKWEDKLKQEKDLLEEEHIRKLYVAATRAENLLVISNADKDIPKSNRPWKEICEKLSEIEKDESEDKELKMREISIPEHSASKSKETEIAEETSSEDLNFLNESIKNNWQNCKEVTYSHRSPSELKTDYQGSNQSLSKNRLWKDLLNGLHKKLGEEDVKVQMLGTEDEEVNSYPVNETLDDIVEEIIDTMLDEDVKNSKDFKQMLKAKGLRDESEIPDALLSDYKKGTHSDRRGPLWGTMVHLLLERLVDNRKVINEANIEKYIEKAVKETLGETLYESNFRDTKFMNQYIILEKALGFKKKDKTKPLQNLKEVREILYEQLKDTAKRFINGVYPQAEPNREKLWQRIQNAEEVVTEYDFEIPLYETEDKELYDLCIETKEGNEEDGENGDMDENKNNGEMFLFSGSIDLMIKENDSWVIVDYKTNRVDNPAFLDEMYRNQLKAYRMLWEKVSGEKVSEAAVITYHVKAWDEPNESFTERSSREKESYLDYPLEEFAEKLKDKNFVEKISNVTNHGVKLQRLNTFLFLTVVEIFIEKTQGGEKASILKEYNVISDYTAKSLGHLQNGVKKAFGYEERDKFENALYEGKDFVEGVNTVEELLDKMIEMEGEAKIEEEYKKIKEYL